MYIISVPIRLVQIEIKLVALKDLLLSIKHRVSKKIAGSLSVGGNVS